MVFNTTIERRQRIGRNVGGFSLIALLFTLICLCPSESGMIAASVPAALWWHVVIAHIFAVTL